VIAGCATPPSEAKRLSLPVYEEHISVMHHILKTIDTENIAKEWKENVYYYTETEAKTKFNADTAITYSFILPEKEYYRDKYNHCKILLIQKKGRGYLPLYCFYDMEAAKNPDKYMTAIEGIFKYKDCAKPLYQQPKIDSSFTVICIAPVVNIKNKIPSDAIVLFDGSDLSMWESVDKGKAIWTIEDSILTGNKNFGNIQTKQNFGDCQLHCEWKADASDLNEGGIFFQKQYNVKISNKIVNNSGNLWNNPALVKAVSDDEWQTFDIAYKAPRFNSEGKIESPARITVFLNGILVQNNVSMKAPTDIKQYAPHSRLPLELINKPVSFRNIWIRELTELYDE
jgi:hypothetical protein